MIHYTHRVRLRRPSGYLVDAAAASASPTVSRQPPAACPLQVSVTGGTANTGAVTLTGTVNGASDSETLTFTGAGTLDTLKRFSALASVSTSGLSDEATPPTLSVQAIGPDGNPLLSRIEAKASYPAYLETRQGSFPDRSSGQTSEQKLEVLIPDNRLMVPGVGWWVNEVGSSEVWEVESVQPLQEGLPFHWKYQLTCKRIA